jgi:hypothetical protein
MMSAMTMSASTFINGTQIDYDQFRTETLAIVKFVKQQMPLKAHQPKSQTASV